MLFSGRRLRQLRREAGLRVVEVCAKADVGTTALYHWEQGATCPDAEQLGKLAACLGVGVDAFFVRPPELVEAGR